MKILFFPFKLNNFIKRKNQNRITLMMGGHLFRELLGNPEKIDKNELLKDAQEIVSKVS